MHEMPRTATAESSQEGGVAALEPEILESQAERRRAQLVRAAGRLIEAEGIEAVSMSRVAKLSGCTRALVHQYFGRREDLLQAVVVDQYEALRNKFDEAELWLTEAGTLEPEQVNDFIDRVLATGWEALDAGGFGGLILWAATHTNPSLRKFIEDVRRPVVDRFIGYAEMFVGSREDAEMLVEALLSAAYRVALRERQGDYSRDEALARYQRYAKGIISGFTRL